jgi:Methyltransferase domain
MAISYLNPSSPKSINQHFREKRFKFFSNLLKSVKTSGRKVRILDIGGTEKYWESVHFGEHDDIHITLLNLSVLPVKSRMFSSVKGDARNLAEYKDNEFDIVFSNSVIEHLYTKENQQKMANEIRRVGKNYYVQTPNYYFPIEPHWLFPFFQFLPFGVRVFLTRNFNMGNYPKSPTKERAIERVNEVKLLSEKEMKGLFPGGKVYREKFLGLTKSLTLYDFPGSNRVNGTL